MIPQMVCAAHCPERHTAQANLILAPNSACPLWYILASMLKRIPIFLLLLAFIAPDALAFAQNSKSSTSKKSSSTASDDSGVFPPESTPAAQPAASSPAAGEPTPHITTVTAPPQLNDPWPLHSKILWAALLALTFISYAGLYFFFEMLKRMGMQTGYIEEAAKAALEGSKAAQDCAKAAQDCANAALMQTQSFIQAERPWILITVEPSMKVENGFMVTATNRGRSPAKISLAADRIVVAVDETQLPAAPEYAKEESPNSLPLPMILLPGESAGVRSFSREDVKWVAKTPESMRRVEFWQEKIFLYGKIVYRDLISAEGQGTHETDWCCWYIHGEKKSGMIIAGPPDYNRHS